MKRQFAILLAAVLILAGGAVLALAQTPQAKQEALPKAEAVLDKFIEATGGRAAYEKVHSRVTAATMEVVGRGISFKMTVYEAPPSKMRTVMEIAGMGKMEEGTDGKVAWALSAMQGPQIKEGQEREQTLLQAAFNSELRWKQLYKTVEVTGVEDVDGQPCYKVSMTSNSGIQQTHYYDKKSGLLVKSAQVAHTQMGDVPTETILSDYRKVGSVLMPFKSTGKMMGMDMVVTIESVKENVEIDPALFQLPEEIKALQAKAGEKM